MPASSAPSAPSKSPRDSRRSNLPGGTGKARRRLTERQRRFVTEYVTSNDGDSRLAAIRAGYTIKSAGVVCTKLLKTPQVVDAIAESRARLRETSEDVTIVDLLKELAILAFSDVTHFQLGEDGKFTLAVHAPKSAWRAVQSIQYEKDKRTGAITKATIRLWSKTEAISLAGKHLGMFIERIAAIVAQVPADFVTHPPKDLASAARFLEQQLGLIESQVQATKDVTPQDARGADAEERAADVRRRDG